MTEFEALGWVFGGFMTLISAYVFIKKQVNDRDDRIIKKAITKNKEKTDIDICFDKTRNQQEQIDSVTSLATATNKLTLEMVKARNANYPAEILKYDTSKALAKYHAKESPEFEKFYKRFEEIERAKMQNDKIDVSNIVQ